MAQKAAGRTRPVRFKVPNNEKVVLTIGTEHSAATLCVLSLTGGAIRGRRVEPGTFADVRIATLAGNMTAVIELLAIRHDGIQAFRFVQIDPTNKKRLQASLESMQAQGLGDKDNAAIDHVIRFARKLFPKSTKS